MFRTVVMVALMGTLLSCNGNDQKKGPKEKSETAEGLGAYFKAGTLPFALTDASLGAASDTTLIAPDLVAPLIADSLKNNFFGKASGLRYTPLAMLTQNGKETYYVVKVAGSKKAAAFVLVFDAKGAFGASYPFLLPDADPATSQGSTLEKNFTITKTVTLRNGAEVVGEGKEVVAYDASAKSFGLIMQDALNDNPTELKNPIDTFRQTNKLAGDYYLNKKNLVAVRDGRYPNQLLVYIHTENESGDCIGQLKGEFILTSTTTAAYRQAGDPCVLNLTFEGNTVSMAEQTGCGNYRGLDCPLGGTFTRKKPQSAKPTATKPKRK